MNIPGFFRYHVIVTNMARRAAIRRHQFLDDDEAGILGILDKDDDDLVLEVDQEPWDQDEEEPEEEDVDKEPDIVEEILEEGTQEVNFLT